MVQGPRSACPPTALCFVLSRSLLLTGLVALALLALRYYYSRKVVLAYLDCALHSDMADIEQCYMKPPGEPSQLVGGATSVLPLAPRQLRPESRACSILDDGLWGRWGGGAQCPIGASARGGSRGQQGEVSQSQGDPPGTASSCPEGLAPAHGPLPFPFVARCPVLWHPAPSPCAQLPLPMPQREGTWAGHRWHEHMTVGRVWRDS